jgi:hypothetical protein
VRASLLPDVARVAMEDRFRSEFAALRADGQEVG